MSFYWRSTRSENRLGGPSKIPFVHKGSNYKIVNRFLTQSSEIDYCPGSDIGIFILLDYPSLTKYTDGSFPIKKVLIVLQQWFSLSSYDPLFLLYISDILYEP